MQPFRNRLILTALGRALALPLAAQEAPAPAADAPAEAPAAPAAPAPAAPAPAAPATEAPAAAPAAPAEGAAAPAAPGGAAAPQGQAGAPGAGDPAKPEVMEIVKDTFGDWQVRCAPDGKECFMYQLAMDQAKNPVAEVSILKLPEQSEAEAGVTVVTPLGTLLTTGVIVQVDNGEQRQYPFAWCSQVGCFARFGLTKPSIDALKRGKAGRITLVSVGRPEHPVELALSLSGFTAAFDSLETPVLPAGAVLPNPSPTPPAQPAARPAPAKPLPDLQPKR
jgi:invasion protein IalB